MKDKFILDACCGGKMMWFNKKHPNALYIDIREMEKGFMKQRPSFEIKPDIKMDFRYLDFPDKSFKLVIWDPLHFLSISPSSWMAQKYGILDKTSWQSDLKKGFNECFRVLDDFGVLVLKWSTETKGRSIQVKELVKLFSVKPLFGHTTRLKSTTKWLVFMKIPGENK